MAWILIFVAIVTVTFAVERITKVHLMENGSTEDVKNLKLGFRIALAAATGLFVLIGLFTSIFVTNEQQTGVVEVLGRPNLISGAGIHFSAPYVSKRTILPATIQGMAFGYKEDSNESIENDALMITSDFNLVNIDFYVEYRIVNAIDYLYGSSNPEGIFSNAVKSAIRNTVGRYDIDSVMTTGKSLIESDILEDVRNELSELHTGLEIISVSVQDAEAPNEEVTQAFMDVESARQMAEKRRNEAQAYENRQIPAAEASAVETVQAAEAKRVERVNMASQEVANFNALFIEYSQNPDVVKEKLYWDTLSDILPNMEIILGSDNLVLIKDQQGDEVK